MNKIKVLCWGDAANAGTGFGVVSYNVLKTLYNTGKYDIDHLAINFHGDFVDKNDIPWNMQPAKLLDPNDPHGVKMFGRTLSKNKYDIVWILNDLYVTCQAAKMISEIKSQYVNSNLKPPVFIHYFPVDCQVKRDSGGVLPEIEIPVCYTHHGRAETLKTFPELSEKLLQVPHGVNCLNYYPLPKEQVNRLKQKYLHVDPDTTVVVNMNRNSTRKQIQYSILAFKEFKKRVPNSIMYLHTAVKDQGGDLVLAIEDLGLSTKTDVTFPVKYSPANPVPDSVLNELYNMGDIFLSTHLGEGWGLSLHPLTFIHTLNGIKYLKDICIGDKVLTNNGEYEEVLDTTSREESTVYKLKPKYSPELITSDLHPYLASKDKGKTLEWLNIKTLQVGDYIAICKPRDTSEDLLPQIDLTNFVNCEKDRTHVWSKMGYSPKLEGLSISKVQKTFNVSKRVAEDALNKLRGKEIVSRCQYGSEAYNIWTHLVAECKSEQPLPIKMKRCIPIDETFLEFIGWYLAEGSSENGVRVELSLHKKEKSIAEKFQSWCYEVLGLDSVVEEFENKSRLRISSSILAKFLQQECGKGSYNKKIPSWLIENPSQLGSLVRGLFLGDGSIAESGYLSLTTTSPSLAYQLRDVCAANNILTSIHEAKIRNGNYIPFVLSFKHRERFGNFIDLPLEREEKDIDCLELDDYFLVPIEKIIRSEDNKDLLYDIYVDNSHSFIANGIVAHNTVTEAMACGLCVVVPNNTCMPQQVGERSERGYMYECKDQTWIDNSGFRAKGLIPDIVDSMYQAYKDTKYNNPKTLAAVQWARQHNWAEVTKQWITIFEKALVDQQTKGIKMGEDV